MAIDCAGNLSAGANAGVEVYSSTACTLKCPTGESSIGGADRMSRPRPGLFKAVTLAVPGLPDDVRCCVQRRGENPAS